MYEMRRRKPAPTLLLTQVIFNRLHHTCMVLKELTFDDAVSYTQRGNGLQQSGIQTPAPRVTYHTL